MIYTMGNTNQIGSVKKSIYIPDELKELYPETKPFTSTVTMPEGGAIFVNNKKIADFTTVKNERIIAIPEAGKVHAITKGGYKIEIGEYRRGGLIKVLPADKTEGEYYRTTKTLPPAQKIVMDETEIKADKPKNNYILPIAAIAGIAIALSQS